MNPAPPKSEKRSWVNPAPPKSEKRSWVNPAPPKNWHYVYLLQSKNASWIYIGCTNDLKNRIKEHNGGKVYSTKKMLPIELIYYEAFKSKKCAYKREKNLKAYGSGLANLKIRLEIDKKGETGFTPPLLNPKGGAG